MRHIQQAIASVIRFPRTAARLTLALAVTSGALTAPTVHARIITSTCDATVNFPLDPVTQQSLPTVGPGCPAVVENTVTGPVGNYGTALSNGIAVAGPGTLAGVSRAELAFNFATTLGGSALAQENSDFSLDNIQFSGPAGVNHIRYTVNVRVAGGIDVTASPGFVATAHLRAKFGTNSALCYGGFGNLELGAWTKSTTPGESGASGVFARAEGQFDISTASPVWDACANDRISVAMRLETDAGVAAVGGVYIGGTFGTPVGNAVALADLGHTMMLPASGPVFNFIDPTTGDPAAGWTADSPDGCIVDNHFMCAPGGRAPIASAGTDQTVNEGTPVTLDGSGSSDPEGAALTYAWTQTAGPSVVLDLTDPIHPTFVAPEVTPAGAILTFQLVVNDGHNDSPPGFVNVTVRDVVSGDRIAPVTTAVLSHPSNGAGWNNTDVSVALSATDNPGGSGVNQITYSATGAQPLGITTVPGASASVLITAEGQTTLGVSATDEAGNAETPHTVVVNVDRTPPELVHQFDPVTRNVVLFGRDALSGVRPGPIRPISVARIRWDDDRRERGVESKERWRGAEERWHQGGAAELRTYEIVDDAGNTLVMKERVWRDHDGIRVEVLSLQYNGAPPVRLAANVEQFEWDLNRDGSVKQLEQRVVIGSGRARREFEATFESRRNQTSIEESPGTHRFQPGLVLLRLVTRNGVLLVEF